MIGHKFAINQYFFQFHNTSFSELHHTLFSNSNYSHLVYTLKSNMFQQLKSYAQHTEPLFQSSIQIYGKAKDATLQAYEANLIKARQAHKQFVAFRKDFIKYAKDISWETVNEIFHIIEVLARVDEGGFSVLEKKRLMERLYLIYHSLLKAYIKKPYEAGKKKAISVYEGSQKFVTSKGLPLYIHLKAVTIVSQEMLRSFIQSRMDNLKMTYETHKDSVLMFFSGNFSEDTLQKKISSGIDCVKQCTIEFLNKGIMIKVDKESLVKNYDKFMVQCVELVHQMREKSEESVMEVRKKSKDLYAQVINRIKAKELEIKTEMRPIESDESFLEHRDI